MCARDNARGSHCQLSIHVAPQHCRGAVISNAGGGGGSFTERLVSRLCLTGSQHEKHVQYRTIIFCGKKKNGTVSCRQGCAIRTCVVDQLCLPSSLRRQQQRKLCVCVFYKPHRVSQSCLSHALVKTISLVHPTITAPNNSKANNCKCHVIVRNIWHQLPRQRARSIRANTCRPPPTPPFPRPPTNITHGAGGMSFLLINPPPPPHPFVFLGRDIMQRHAERGKQPCP